MIRKYKNLIPKVPASCFIFPTAEIIGSVELGLSLLHIFLPLFPYTSSESYFCFLSLKKPLCT